MSSQELFIILIGLGCVAIVLALIYLSKKKKKAFVKKENKNMFGGAEDIDALAEYNKMNAAPPTERDELGKQYAGRRVMWNVTYDSILKIDDDTIQVMALYMGNYPWIYFCADTNEYSFIRDIVQGQKLMLTGTIEKYDHSDGGFTVNADNIELI